MLSYPKFEFDSVFDPKIEGDELPRFVITFLKFHCRQLSVPDPPIGGCRCKISAWTEFDLAAHARISKTITDFGLFRKSYHSACY